MYCWKPQREQRISELTEVTVLINEDVNNKDLLKESQNCTGSGERGLVYWESEEKNKNRVAVRQSVRKTTSTVL